MKKLFLFLAASRPRQGVGPLSTGVPLRSSLRGTGGTDSYGGAHLNAHRALTPRRFGRGGGLSPQAAVVARTWAVLRVAEATWHRLGPHTAGNWLVTRWSGVHPERLPMTHPCDSTRAGCRSMSTD